MRWSGRGVCVLVGWSPGMGKVQGASEDRGPSGRMERWMEGRGGVAGFQAPARYSTYRGGRDERANERRGTPGCH